MHYQALSLQRWLLPGALQLINPIDSFHRGFTCILVKPRETLCNRFSQINFLKTNTSLSAVALLSVCHPPTRMPTVFVSRSSPEVDEDAIFSKDNIGQIAWKRDCL